MSTGEQIRKYRKIANISQKELGNRLGISQQQIAQYENGKRTPKIETLQKIADALCITSNDLLGESEITKDMLEFQNINNVLEILSRANYTILQVPCMYNSGEWKVRTITPDGLSAPITAAFNDKLSIMTRGCINFNGKKQYCNSCNKVNLTVFIIEKNGKRFSLTIEEMKKHIDDIINYIDFIFSSVNARA